MENEVRSRTVNEEGFIAQIENTLAYGKQVWFRANQNNVGSVNIKKGEILARKTIRTPHMQNEVNLNTQTIYFRLRLIEKF